ncbi:MAG: PD-(D/E)XK nuclease family protein [Lachnospiraceae bacterium]|nr:PD-(D/E)XK nuclease family protein [Lachnospiraceae bacterium]
MLHLVLGPSGTGKSYKLLERVISEAGKNRSRNYLYVVPEQFTLHTQREMIEKSPNHGIMNIDVLSFPRLAHRVFEETGYEPPVILEDTGKSMIVKKVALDHADELGVFAGKIHRQGFIDQMKSVIAEFYQYSVDEDKIRKMMSMTGNRSQLRSKLADIELIYHGFQDFIKDRFIMNEELLGLLIEKAPGSKLLRDSVLVFDGFTGFTVIQLRCIEQLLSLASDVYVSLTTGINAASEAETHDSLFELSGITIGKLTRIAEKNGSKVVTEIMEETVPYRFKDSSALAALERNIFRRPVRQCRDHRGINLASCENPTAEVRYIIGKIKELTGAGSGYRYGEIAVITGDLASYEGVISREFTRAGIPYFMDIKKSIIGTEPVELLRSVIMAALNGFDKSDVLRFAKSSLSGFAEDEAAALENYCVAKVSKGTGFWDREWTKSYRTKYRPDLNRLNDLRKRVVTMLIGPALELEGKITVRERVNILRRIMESLNIEEQLSDRENAGKDSAEPAVRLEALEAGQLYGIIGDVLERIEKLLGDDLISLREFAEILDTGFKEAKLALIPQESDQIVIGDMERTRLGVVKALFFIGVNDGLVPRTQGDQGLLSYADRMLFEENDIELSPVGMRSSYLQEFYLYLNMTRPMKQLTLTYHRMTSDKKPAHRSYIFSEIMKIFPELKIKDVFRNDTEMLVESDRGRHTVAGIVRDRDIDRLSAAERTICAVIAQRSPEEFAMMLKAAFESRSDSSITENNAEGLYGKVLNGSVTMLEKYAECAYSHFLRYGLQLEERTEFKVGAAEMGNIYHKAVELYGRELKRRGIKWHETTPEIREEVMNAALDGAVAEYDEIIGSSRRNQYIRTRAQRVLARTVQVLDHQVRGGSFEPEYFEESFRTADSFMDMVGKIDRIDVSEAGGKKYVRIIDYKSGKKQFDLVRLYNGLQIQLAVYMNRAEELVRERTGSEPFTSGVYYYNIDDPIINGDRSDNAEAAIISELKLKGPSDEESASLRASDTGLIDDAGNPVGGYASDIISVKNKVSGGFDSNSDLLTREQFTDAGEYAVGLMRHNAQKILKGKTSITPCADGKINACTYCPYRSVCGFEYRLGYRYRQISGNKGNEDVLWEKMINKEYPAD